MKGIWIGGAAVVLALGAGSSCGGGGSSTPQDGGDNAGGCTSSDECLEGYTCSDSHECTLVLPALDSLPADLSCIGNNPPPTPLGTTVTETLYVEDFETGDPVEGATIELFLDGVMRTTPDATVGPSDASGLVHGVADLPARGLIAYRIPQDDHLPGGKVRTTIQYDILIPDADAGQIRLVSVSDSTYRLIQTVLGIIPDPSLGVVAGEFTDCSTGAADVEGAAVRLMNAAGQDCHALDSHTCYSRYFHDSSPVRPQYQAYSSPDGLYGVIQVPPGLWTLELRGRLTAATTDYPFDLLGRRDVQVVADSIVIVDLKPLAAPAS